MIALWCLPEGNAWWASKWTLANDEAQHLKHMSFLLLLSHIDCHVFQIPVSQIALRNRPVIMNKIAGYQTANGKDFLVADETCLNSLWGFLWQTYSIVDWS